MNATTVFGVIAGILTGVSLLPQLIKILREKKVENVSVWMLLILVVGLGLWVAYGILKKDPIIVITNSFSFLVNVIILILRFRYKDNG
ncbi:MAG TPA: SemiSWEET transporter [Chitinophagaceae bacterium]|jgi:MtN3 and saliva related transmembrane protein|nr:SemiSWEET transporter [Chitinophagaceae bacterium]